MSLVKLAASLARSIVTIVAQRAATERAPGGAGRARAAAMLQVRRGYSRETSFKRVRLPGVGGAAQAVRDAGSPLDGSHAELASGPPLRAELFHSAVRLALDGVQRDRLARSGWRKRGHGGACTAARASARARERAACRCRRRRSLLCRFKEAERRPRGGRAG